MNGEQAIRQDILSRMMQAVIETYLGLREGYEAKTEMEAYAHGGYPMVYVIQGEPVCAECAANSLREMVDEIDEVGVKEYFSSPCLPLMWDWYYHEDGMEDTFIQCLDCNKIIVDVEED